jgi:hypothetical protein
LFSVLVPLDSAGPVPPPAAVPVPGFPLDGTVPASPPTMPVSLPFLVSTSVAVLGGTTGSCFVVEGVLEDEGVDEVAGGAPVGAGAGGGDLSLHATISAIGSAAHSEWWSRLRIFISSRVEARRGPLAPLRQAQCPVRRSRRGACATRPVDPQGR